MLDRNHEDPTRGRVGIRVAFNLVRTTLWSLIMEDEVAEEKAAAAEAPSASSGGSGHKAYSTYCLGDHKYARRCWRGFYALSRT